MATWIRVSLTLYIAVSIKLLVLKEIHTLKVKSTYQFYIVCI